MLTVKYTVHYETIVLTTAEYHLIRALANRQQSVIGIKFIRDQYKLGLRESKEIFDAVNRGDIVTDQSNE